MKSLSTFSKKKLTELILENLMDAVLIVDEGGKIQFTNKAAEVLFGKLSDQLYHQPFGFPIIPYQVQEIQVLRDSRISTVQMLASLVNFEGNNIYILSLRDITRQKIIEAELEEEREKLVFMNLENEQYENLASHDFLEPLRKIKLFADMLLNQEPDFLLNSRLKLEKISQAVHRMQTLMSGIAEYSRVTISAGKFEPTDLNTVVNAVIKDLESLINEHNVKIVYGRLPTIQAIPRHIHQLFFNLISNAVKYRKPAVAPIITIKLQKSNSKVFIIQVRDNGMGFENEYVVNIFKPFSRMQLHDTYEGSGIGLAICKKILEEHGGKIEAFGIPNRGSKFILTFLKYPEM